MKLLDKIKLNILRRVLPKTRVKDITPADLPPGTYQVLYSGSNIVWSNYPDWRMEEQVTNFRDKVYDAISYVIKGVQSAEWNIYKRDGTGPGEIIESHQFHELMMNPLGNDVKQGICENDLWYDITANLLIFGNAIMIPNVRGKIIDALYPVPPQIVIPNPVGLKVDGKPVGVQVNDSYTINWNGRGYNYDADEIVHLQYIDPDKTNNFKWGKSPIQAHGWTIDTRNYMHTTQNNIFKRGAVPDIILNLKGGITDDQQKERLREEWYHRYGGTYEDKPRMAVIDGELSDLITLDSKLNELQFVEGLEVNSRDVASAFGVPPLFLGITQGANYAEAREAMRSFKENTLQPLLDHISSQINQDLIWKVYGNDVIFKFESVVPADDLKKREDARMLFEKGAITIDELREMYDMPPFREDWSESTYLPMNLLPTGYNDTTEPQPTPDDTDEIDANKRIKLVRPADNRKIKLSRTAKDDINNADITVVTDDRKLRIYQINEPLLIEHKRDSRNNRGKWVRVQGIVERKFIRDYRGFMRDFFKSQFESVKTRMRISDKKKLMDLINRKEIQESDLDFILPNVNTSTQALMARSQPTIEQLLLFSKDTTLSAIGGSSIPGVNYGNVADDVLGLLETGGRSEGVFKFAHEVNVTTLNKLRDELTEGIRAGEPISELARRVDNIRDNAMIARSETIARTEIVGAYNRASMTTTESLVSEIGQGTIRKFWYSSQDVDTRDNHLANDNESIQRNGIPIDERWTANGLLYPSEPNGPAGEVINCRCAGGEVIEDVDITQFAR